MHCFKLMSKMAIMAVMFLVITAVSAFSTPINSYWDLGAVGLGDYTADKNTTTGTFNQILYLANFNTTQYDTIADGVLTVGDQYTSHGNVIATNLAPVGATDTEGLTVDYEFVFVLRDLLGVVQEIQTGDTVDTVTNRYLSGTIDMYINHGTPSSFNGTLDLSGDSGFGGSLVASINNVHGIGSSTFKAGTQNFKTGSYDVSGTFTYMLPGFWFDENGDDLETALVNLGWLIGSADGNVDHVDQDFSMFTQGGTLYTIDSDSNASFELTAVPEPATCLLLGCGLIGLSGISRKKLKK